jgi:hypothetical protein
MEIVEYLLNSPENGLDLASRQLYERIKSTLGPEPWIRRFRNSQELEIVLVDTAKVRSQH